MEPTIKYENCEDLYIEQNSIVHTETGHQSEFNEIQESSMPTHHYFGNHQQSTQSQNSLKRGYNQLENVDFHNSQQQMQNNFDMFNHPNAMVEANQSTLRTDAKPLKKYKRGEASMLFSPPFFKLIEGFYSPAYKDAIAARCYACGKIVKGNRSISSNFIKHLKRCHPEISKIYDSYKIYRIKTGLLPNAPMLERKVDTNKSNGAGGNVPASASGDSNDDNNTFFDATTLLDTSEIGDEDKHSDNSDDNEDSLNMIRESSENNENSKESQQQLSRHFENSPVELSPKALEALGNIMDAKLQNFVKQTEFEQLADKVNELIKYKNDSVGSNNTTNAVNTSPTLLELNTEIKNLKQECSALRFAVQQSQASNRQLQNELQTVDQLLHQRKLIIRNIKVFDTAQPIKSVEKLFHERLNLDDIKIVNCNIIPPITGTTESNKECVSIELQNPQDSKTIFRQTHKLKNTGIFIEPEISAFQRKRKNKLMVIRKELLRRKDDLKVVVRNTTLIVNGKNFYWDNVEGLCHDANKDAIEMKGCEYLNHLTGLNLTEFINILQNYEIQIR